MSSAQATKTDAGGSTRFEYEKVTEPDGKVVWRVRGTTSSYRIPDDYVATITPGSIVLRMHWPSTLGVQDASLLGKVHGEDLVIIILEPLRVPPIRDSYELDIARGGRVELKPSTRYPGLLEIYRDGKPTVNLVSGPEGPRTPSGNPYSFNAPFRDEPASPCCDTRIALPEGNSVRIRFASRHLADWHRIYPEVLRLIESFKKG